MTATNMCSDFGSFRCRPSLTTVYVVTFLRAYASSHSEVLSMSSKTYLFPALVLGTSIATLSSR